MAKKDTYKEYARALYETTVGLTGSKLRDQIGEFTALLARRQKIKQVVRIMAEFKNYSEIQAGLARITITAAHRPSDQTIAAIKKVFGSKVEESLTLDDSLLGGVIIKNDNTIFDASLKTQLARLKQSLLV